MEKYNNQFNDVKYFLKKWRSKCDTPTMFTLFYSHINTYSLEYLMLFGMVTIMFLKNQERKYICYPQPYYDE